MAAHRAKPNGAAGRLLARVQRLLSAGGEVSGGDDGQARGRVTLAHSVLVFEAAVQHRDEAAMVAALDGVHAASAHVAFPVSLVQDLVSAGE